MLTRIGRMIDLWCTVGSVLAIVALAVIFLFVDRQWGLLLAVPTAPAAFVAYFLGKSARYVLTDPVEADRASVDRKLALDDAYRKGVAAGEKGREADKLNVEWAARRDGIHKGVIDVLYEIFKEMQIREERRISEARMRLSQPDAERVPKLYPDPDTLRSNITAVVSRLTCIQDDGEKTELVDRVVNELVGSWARISDLVYNPRDGRLDSGEFNAALDALRKLSRTLK